MPEDTSNPGTQDNNPAATTQEQQAAAEANQRPDPDSLFADQLANIVSDDGRQKYNDVPTALASIPHAQGHIKSLTDENAALKEQLAKAKGAEEVLEALSKQSNQQQVEGTPSDTGLNETAIEGIVSSLLQKQAQQSTAASNSQTVMTALQNKFGDLASREFENKAKALNLPVATLSELSRQSPQVVLELFDAKAVRDPQPTTPSSLSLSPEPNAPDEPDYMKKFRSGDSTLIDKWKAAKAAVATN